MKFPETSERATSINATVQSRTTLKSVIKWVLFLVVMGFVARHGYRLWTQVGHREVRIQWNWLGLATFLSVLAWIPSVWYWRWLLERMGDRVSWKGIARAYYCGHLGKYVPGKAAVILIRAALLKRFGVHPAHAAFAVTFESLTYMSAGAVTAAMLFSWIVGYIPELAGPAAAYQTGLWRIGLPVLVLGAAIVGLMVSSQLLGRLVSKMTRGAVLDQATTARLNSRVWLTGLFTFLPAWWIQGGVIGATIFAVSPNPHGWTDWPVWTGTAAIAMVGGFAAVFAPGGLGVREGLLMELLRNHTDPQTAVLVAVFSRAVSLAGEILASAALYYGLREKPDQTPASGRHEQPVEKGV
jgi:glycosyltransferase 2 family protein